MNLEKERRKHKTGFFEYAKYEKLLGIFKPVRAYYLQDGTIKLFFVIKGEEIKIEKKQLRNYRTYFFTEEKLLDNETQLTDYLFLKLDTKEQENLFLPYIKASSYSDYNIEYEKAVTETLFFTAEQVIKDTTVIRKISLITMDKEKTEFQIKLIKEGCATEIQMYYSKKYQYFTFSNPVNGDPIPVSDFFEWIEQASGYPDISLYQRANLYAGKYTLVNSLGEFLKEFYLSSKEYKLKKMFSADGGFQIF